MQRVFSIITLLFVLTSCGSEPAVVVDEPEPLPLLPRFALVDSNRVVFKDKSPCLLSYIKTNGDTVFADMKVGAKYRGGFTVQFPKRSYTIELADDLSLEGLATNDDWMLISNHNDRSFLRHKMSYDLFTAFSESNIAPRTAFVELHRDGNYDGIYVLTEKMGKTKLQMALDDTNAVIFKDPPVFRDPKYPDIDNQQPPDNWFHQKYPKTKNLNKNHELYWLRGFIHSSSDKAFADTVTGIPAIFDLDNIIDWHILLFVTNNGDGVFKNFYMYRPNGNTGYRICPWDYDHTFGRDGDSELNLENKAKILNNALLRRLLETNAAGYKDRLKARYDELLSKGLLTETYLNNYIDAQTEILKPSIAANAERWPVDDDVYFDKMTNEEEWKLIKDWWKNHLKYVSEYMNSL